MRYTYIVIGSSAAGISAINTLSALQPTAPLLCISAQNEMPYNTCFLIDVAAGIKSTSDISLRIAGQKSNYMLGKSVIALDREKKSIILSDNSEILYQKLLIATGARPYLSSILGRDAAGVFTFHTLADVQALLDWINKKSVCNALIIGAGLTGLECAHMLHQKGIMVTIVEQKDYLLSRHLARAGALLVEQRMVDWGIQLICNTRVISIKEKNNSVHVVILDDGKEIATDLIIIATGTQPNSEFAHTADLARYNNHFMVNEYMQTTDPSIFAAGDVAVITDHQHGMVMPSGTWADAVHQGIVAAHAMAGNAKPYSGALSLINATFFGLKFAAGGMQSGEALIEHTNQGQYVRVVYSHTIPLGFQFIGEQLTEIAPLRRAMLLKQPFNFF